MPPTMGHHSQVLSIAHSMGPRHWRMHAASALVPGLMAACILLPCCSTSGIASVQYTQGSCSVDSYNPFTSPCQETGSIEQQVRASRAG